MNDNRIIVNDVIRITKGIYKGQLGLVVNYDKDNKFYEVKVIINGMKMLYKYNTLILCYRNSPKAAELWENLIDYNQRELIRCYNDIKYIRENFEIDYFICNDLVVNTIRRIIGLVQLSPNNGFNWFYANKEALSIIFYYKDTKFVIEYCRLISKTINEEAIIRLHKAAWRD